MNILGLEELVFGVEDISGAAQYLVDYGLTPAVVSEVGGRFEAADGTAVVIWQPDHPQLPAPMSPTAMIRETVYRVADEVTLEAIAEEMARDRPVRRGPNGSVHVRDDMGFALGFKVSRRRHTLPPGLPTVNEIGADPRMPVVPQTLSHVVYFVPDHEKAERFYIERLGFRVTDRFTGVGPFLRCAGSQDHHCLFMIQAPEFMKGVEHFTFHFASGTHVLLGGTRFAQKGYQSFWGPGRHLFGSNWFWYFNSPFGCKMEFDAEMDLHDDSWVAREAPLIADNAQLFLFTAKEKWAPGPGPKPAG